MTELTAGRELDALIAEKVMGWKLSKQQVSADAWDDVWRNEDNRLMAYCRKWKPTGDISSAWRVLEKMSETWPEISICKSRWTQNVGYYECVLEKPEDDRIVIEADTAPLAISLAALKTVEATQKEKSL